MLFEQDLNNYSRQGSGGKSSASPDFSSQSTTSRGKGAWEAVACLTPHCIPLAFRKIKASIFSSDSPARRFDTMWPAAEKTLSAGTEVAGTQSTLVANFARCGNREAFTSHHRRGSVDEGAGFSLKYVSTSFSSAMLSQTSWSVAVPINKSSAWVGHFGAGSTVTKSFSSATGQRENFKLKGRTAGRIQEW